MGVTTGDKGDDAADIERTVAEIKTASALGAAVWCLFLLRSVYVLQVLRYSAFPS